MKAGAAPSVGFRRKYLFTTHCTLKQRPLACCNLNIVSLQLSKESIFRAKIQKVYDFGRIKRLPFSRPFNAFWR